MYNILICDDDRDIVAALKIYLSSQKDYRLFEAYTGKQALEAVKNNDIQLVLLDIMMPEMDGIAVTAKLRETSNIPIILLTAKSESADKVHGLNVGADDYITKPFSMRELIARVGANIRRTAMLSPVESGSASIEAGDLRIDPDSRQVFRAGQPLELTQREYELLHFLAARPNKVYSRTDLMEQVWNYDYVGDDARTVDVTVRRLREKVEADPANPVHILTRRGAGYYFAK